MTLKQFIKQSGSMEKAAAKIGVSYSTVFRLMHPDGKRKPSDMLMAILKGMGITEVKK